MKLEWNKCRAFTFVDFLILIAVVVLLAVVALPLLARRYAPYSSAINCTNNLKQIGLAYRQWAIDHGGKFPMQISVTNGGAMELVEAGVVYPAFLVMSNELLVPKLLICPKEDRKRVVANTFEQTMPVGPASASQRIAFTNDRSVSYFVGLDAEEVKPSTMLGGDDDFLINGSQPNSGLLLLRTNSQVAWTTKRHSQRGNFLFSDGSVAATPNPAIQKVLIKTGMATNRLALP